VRLISAIDTSSTNTTNQHHQPTPPTNTTQPQSAGAPLYTALDTRRLLLFVELAFFLSFLPSFVHPSQVRGREKTLKRRPEVTPPAAPSPPLPLPSLSLLHQHNSFGPRAAHEENPQPASRRAIGVRRREIQPSTAAIACVRLGRRRLGGFEFHFALTTHLPILQ
jgi:hypothetical protein